MAFTFALSPECKFSERNPDERSDSGFHLSDAAPAYRFAHAGYTNSPS